MKDKMRGQLEELWGRLTGNRRQQVKGQGRQTVGEAKRVGKEIVYDAEHPGYRDPRDEPGRRPE